MKMLRMLSVFVMLCAMNIAPAMGGPRKTLRPFTTEAEFNQWLGKLKAIAEEQNGSPAPVAYAPPPPPSARGPAAAAAVVAKAMVASSQEKASGNDSITNVQTQGVDEGDIVKKVGDFLVVLRRGRLFTIGISDGQLQPVSAVNAYAPHANPANTWYDEMLVSDKTVVVIGYSYERGGTEIGLFDLNRSGQLQYRATYQMRSNDYYSDRNYASRLIGNQLIFYTPLSIDLWDPDPAEYWPALRRWHRGATPKDFKRILPATRIYRSPSDLELEDGLALHSVTTCDLSAPTMRCRSTAVLGPEGRVFYVSEDAVYIWTAPWSHEPSKPNAAALFRMPLDGSAPTGLRASGSPIDQMSFLQRDGFLNVLVGSEANGEGMWAPDSRAGELALLRLPLSALGDMTEAAKPDDYRRLPGNSQDSYELQNRFVGDWLIYGRGGPVLRKGKREPVRALRYAASGPVEALHIDHKLERIDALGAGAILVGSAADGLHFTSVRLGERANPHSSFIQRGASQGDDRSHGYFYRPTADTEGIVGLPTIRIDPQSKTQSSAVLYLRNRQLRLSRLGELASQAPPRADDDCKVSCVDWYGNARPIFVGDRVFALLGYELVEGELEGEGARIRERSRTNFAPHTGTSN